MTISAVSIWKEPGIGTLKEIIESSDVWFGRWENQIIQGHNISGATRDAGNDKTTKLRPGLVLGKITASGLLKEFTPAATDGTEIPFAVLGNDLDTQEDGVDKNLFIGVFVAGFLKEASLLVPGAAAPGLSGNANEHAIRAMFQGRFVFDDMLNNVIAGAWRGPTIKTGDYTVLESDNGTLFTTEGTVANVNFTLPATAERHLRYRFFNSEDFNLTVTAGTADTLIAFNDVAVDSVAFSTASEKIGGMFEIFGDGSKWIVIVNLGQDTQTVTVVT